VTDGTAINLTGTAGDRRITGLAAATQSNDAVKFGQLKVTVASIASIVGGGSQVNTDGTVRAPSFTIQGFL
jgi:hypothetical protein